jgi:hypothetical protein
MCIHKHYIFITCGHTTFSPTPLLACPTSLSSSTTPTPLPPPSPCIPHAHPFHSYTLHIPCTFCAAARSARLAAVADRTRTVEVPAARWRATYGEYRGEEVEAWKRWGEEGGRGEEGVYGAVRREELVRRWERWVKERELRGRR